MQPLRDINKLAKLQVFQGFEGNVSEIIASNTFVLLQIHHPKGSVHLKCKKNIFITYLLCYVFGGSFWFYLSRILDVCPHGSTMKVNGI